MINRHLRKAVLASVAITAGLLMTACQSGTGADASGKNGTGAAAVAEKVSDAENSKDSSGSGSSGTANAANPANSARSKGVSGSFENGKVSYLAPGKYIVSAPGKGDQQFWVSDDTEVHGAGTICGDAGSRVDAPCTLDQLEAATKKGAVGADVEMRNGVATLVTERRAAAPQGSGTGSRETAVDGVDKGRGVSGTWFGNVSLLAPGKFTVSGLKGVEQQFFVAEDTDIRGYDDICGDAGTAGRDGTKCTEQQLETAARKGFGAEVVISNGIATSIRDDH
ncbi:hypothetical protein [Streptomyces sp. ME109]|uniref:hypothetical protein n=1 Tax=Streptomyces sp. me109 TaxID=1827853 RepID=UPI0021C94FD0|nr:hypothetical protein [Streptomyces sp. me109]